jgi:hypothetical protein
MAAEHSPHWSSGKVTIIVVGLAVVYLMTFVGGFLQATPYNFVNYIFLFLLFIGGIALIMATVKSEATLVAQGFLYVAGVCATLLFVFFVGYDWFRLQGNEDLEGSLEGFLYLLTLFFWIGVIGSLIVYRSPQASE